MKKESYKKLDGKTRNLVDQVNKLFRGDNQKSIKTRYRYLAAQERFCKWLSQNTNLKKLQNVKARHFIKYTEHLKNQKLSPKMIKAELSGVRHFHKLTGSRETLPVNKRLNIPRIVTNGGINRSWSQKEVKDAIALAEKMGRTDVIMGIKICYAFGTRIEEVITLNTKQITNSIKNLQLDLENTKGHRPRGVNVGMKSKYKNMQIRALQYAKEHALSKDKVFIKPGKQTHATIKRVQNWVINHRSKFQKNDIRIDRNEARKIATYNRDNNLKVERPRANLSMHGLRHSYADNLYREILERSKTIEKDRMEERTTEIEKEARFEVSNMLGHGRDQITRIYI
ncbi:tyrosine-type recombinase/integrase [Clostridium botulinum D/C]|uniref:tyrosine-type recombinase/integrase n=1 Tax=Clostridium botulinum TaxID=1491 RepID=UPI001E2AC073|nr:tyrosine-type recombinase/integrase [Clostridium botulinum]MCD3352141.1 tyrosine-type recombinase/integrase [Clostridium botulinum D/C]MCD3361088.1 tyrosine-type recombinase/integrase [Clostridium botulinum D/C]MCD3363679.1 tyrosine-type recombinase/integrase [Clostridium botulinum D/C]MCD3366846.1 tyrosine-type recombinase/integrase [Clostridium botulinum D/C]